ncbi:MAG: Formate hydrogenlyase subunit 3/multisubunit Na+/H+ antiporter, MnhD subunit [Candidatus Moranbacteria bacterium GW2011_GWE1_35_17]|nr:MAG: Formate hydrogenlyase subunit 3/multisubunit Na+/H+ antiporter, MnhD subunit [Candidatus Moranbacteria bacterium GW2011_GWE1_35_17]KKP72220.1 MAG: Formate hydrogenlyase subunit 3/multisubunit Na+/H+ antiporter, MnhD subunit [Candidatus Moranbacteria bacterium GW2011_GWE2_35_164]KKP83890.1 MAG: Formate hydrogenlyase subunit 3/multisubunit Na+/H+ antiporter, MnhD subunit [Candidatus Moranbacteria bacterium GW2011_GWF2_35_54]
MLEQILNYSIGFYFIGLSLSAGVSFFDKSYKKATILFIYSNLVGLLSGIIYFVNFFPQRITLAHFDWFFKFAPQLNLLSAIFFILVSSVAILVGIYSLRYLELYKESYNPKIVQLLMSLFVLGMQGVFIANNSFSFLFFWEAMSITSFFLVFSDRTNKSIKAAFLYFIMTHLGASAILGGFLILGNGSLLFDLDNIKNVSQDLSYDKLCLVFFLFLFGFGSKAGLVPFHVWLPEAHPQAPSNISALMSGLMLKVAVYGFVFITLSLVSIPAWAGLVVIFLGLLSAMVGVLYATMERDIKRALAYSSIENMGIIFTMLGLAIYFLANNLNSLVAYGLIAFAIFHAINHALFKTALFLSSGVIINRVHTKSLDAMGGIAKLMPWFSGAFLLAILGSLPLPPLGTFYGEWGLVQSLIALMHQNIYSPSVIILLLIVLVVIGLVSGLAVLAMVRIFGISMLGLPRNIKMERRSEKTDYLLILPILILGVAFISLGFLAKPIISELIFQIQFFQNQESISLAPLNISSLFVGGAIFIFGCLIYISKDLFFKNKKERNHKTWDCGQPIDSIMQYSATAFSAPIRFFFLTFIGRKKVLQSEPVVKTNPWIRRYSFELSIRSVWSDALYRPTARGLFLLAEKARLIQNGRIQYYILFLLFALIITLIFAL